jgi:hypothetical protein
MPEPWESARATRFAPLRRVVTQTMGAATSWQSLLLVGSASVLGVGWLSAALLFKLPSLPNCPATFWPTSSASLRLYCAQLAANKQTVDDLLAAIATVNDLPQNHPMRPEAERHIQQWANDILDLADETFHRGELQGAIAIAQRIPQDTDAHQDVSRRIESWREVWASAESLYGEAEDLLFDGQDPRKAFDLAVQLLTVGNRYWETTKYQQLQDLITASREDGSRLAEIRQLARQGGLTNLLKAVEMAREIKPNSPIYSSAQRLIDSIGRDMMAVAEASLDRRNLEEALAIVDEIPNTPALQQDVQDFKTVAQARAQSWQGTVADLQAAVVQLQRMRSDRPLYGKAQEWIARWQLEIQDVGTLARAREVAALGTLGDLRAAIAEARAVPRGNPRSDEANELIREWTTEIETTEDRPLLTQADSYASVGDLPSAIAVAQRIRSGRALHDEAQTRIQGWTNQIQRAQDQPVLDRARQLASSGDLTGAIVTAERIRAGRVLHTDAQNELRAWRTQVEAQSQMQQARSLATARTPAALLESIRLAGQVPAGTSVSAEATRMVNQWSSEVLQAAQSRAGYDLVGAIALMEQLPPNTPAYAQAQSQLTGLRQLRDQMARPARDYSIETEATETLEPLDDVLPLEEGQ